MAFQDISPLAPDTGMNQIILIGSLEGNCYMEYTTPNIDKPVNAGVCQISQDGSRISFSYSPLIKYSDIPDSTVIYTFIGVKM